MQTKNNQYEIALTFLTGYNGIFNVTNENNNFYFTNSNTDEDGFIQKTVPQGAYEIEILKNGIERNIIEEEHYTEANYAFTIKPNFSTIASTVEKSTQRPVITFVPDDSIRDLLGFNKTTIYEEYNLSPDPLDILLFHNIFLQCNIAQGMIFRGRRSVNIHNFTVDVDPGNENIEKFQCGVQWYMMESKDILSSICFLLKNENNQIVYFNGQSITFR